jgi:hypothetical protein
MKQLKGIFLPKRNHLSIGVLCNSFPRNTITYMYAFNQPLCTFFGLVYSYWTQRGQF